MKESKLIIAYSSRLLLREWRRFVLPFLSLAITGVVMIVVLLLTGASSLLLSEQARDLLGGDAVIESNEPVEIERLWQENNLKPVRQSLQIDFTASIQSAATAIPASVLVVDSAYPLYGKLALATGEYMPASAEELYIDVSGAERLAVTVGDTVTFGETSFVVAGIIVSEPSALFSGFRFLPRVIMSDAGFARTGVDPQLLRAEYEYAVQIDNLTEAQKTEAEASIEAAGYDIDFAGSSRMGLQRGLSQVAEFLIVAVLITAVLSAVNVYASTLYLLSMLRRSFAVLLALGMKRSTLIGILGATLGYVVLCAGLVASVLGTSLYFILSDYIAGAYNIILPVPNLLFYGSISTALIFTIALGSFVPAVRNIFSVSPRSILITGELEEGVKIPLCVFLFNTFSTLVPLSLLAIFLLGDFINGVLITLGIVAVYVFVAVVFYLVLRTLYRVRGRFPFIIRSIVAQKKADGLFGVVSFTSLFIALASLSTLVLIQVSLERYLTEDLTRTIPTTYVIDVQPSQKAVVEERFPDLTLFASVPSRITEIDGRYIQELLEVGDEGTDRELGREFNLTFRKELLQSESIVAGSEVVGVPGEISVDQAFAERAGIVLGSTMTFLIQGFPVSGIVTSMRETDSRSGLPFFYFVLAPEDIAEFPSVHFGYSYYEGDRQEELTRFLATTMPNVSVIQTEALGPILVALIGTLMAIIYIITIPPLLIATLLIATLVISSYSSRRREGARLRALGATKGQVLVQYLGETLVLTLAADVAAYGLGGVVAYVVATKYLNVDSSAWYDTELLVGLALLVSLIAILGVYLFKSDTMPLRQLLAYEENH
jgi:putative ABC transport system permease protein